MSQFTLALGAAFITIVAALGQVPRPTSLRGDLTIRGRITDQSGALVPGVAVRVKNPAIRLARSGITNESGEYSVSGLSAARYVVTTDLESFQTERRDIDMAANGARYVIDFLLRLTPINRGPGVSASFDSSLIDNKAAMEKAEHLVEQLWELPLRRTELGQPEGISMMEMHQRRITEGLRLLGKNAVPALILGLEDPDAQMRRNAALILWDLAGGLSNVAQPRLDCREALPALTKALTDSDLSVKEWAGAAIAAIRLAEASNNQKQP